jgi:Holliday junction resolvase
MVHKQKGLDCIVNKHYQSGRVREYQIRDYLAKNGYTVIRSAGSHSEIDLIAINRTKIILIQSKKGVTMTTKAKAKLVNKMPRLQLFVTPYKRVLDDNWKVQLEEFI